MPLQIFSSLQFSYLKHLRLSSHSLISDNKHLCRRICLISRKNLSLSLDHCGRKKFAKFSRTQVTKILCLKACVVGSFVCAEAMSGCLRWEILAPSQLTNERTQNHHQVLKKNASIASSCPYRAFEVAEKIPILKQVSILAREIGS